MESSGNEKFLWFLLSEVEITLYRVTSALQRSSTSAQSSHTLNEHCTRLRAAKSNLQQGLRKIFSNRDSDISFLPEDIDDIRDIIQQAVSLEELASTEAFAKEASYDYTELHEAKSLRVVGGKWTQTLANHCVDPKDKLTTAVGRLKRDYDMQVKNILLLEKERNALEVRILDLENKLQRAHMLSKELRERN